MIKIPVIDIFAGPGGLSEGFSSYSAFFGKAEDYEVKLSIEKDKVAAQTLMLRSFYRKFPYDKVSDAYYDYIRGNEAALEALKSTPEWAEASAHVWNGALGEIRLTDLHTRIKRSLAGEKNWVLLGGPPCQAYSLIGRARMSGLGHDLRNGNLTIEQLERLRHEKEAAFLKDHRHTLYREYLRIVGVHQPAVFVMENVKGILSSKLPDGFTETGKPKFKQAFSQIRTDLENPWKVLREDENYHILRKFRSGAASRYKLHSFVQERSGNLLGEYSDTDFLIKSENYGVPQKRHRVIILGVREDIQVTPAKLRLSKTTTVRDVLEGLPELRSGLSKEDDTEENWLRIRNETLPKTIIDALPEKSRIAIKAAQKPSDSTLSRGSKFIPIEKQPKVNQSKLTRWLTDERLGGVIQHETRSHMNADIGRYLFVSAIGAVTGQSPRLDEWPVKLLPAHKNVFAGDVSKKISDFKDRFKVQVYDHPASTITAHISKDGHYFIHPDPKQGRSFTVREAARVQTFPDNYFFSGNRTQQYQQIGNAVPPYLALQLAQVVANLLANKDE